VKIGDKAWTRGIELTITSEPYELHGAIWQDAIDENGKTYTVISNEQREKNVASARREHAEMQAGFRKLREITQTG